MGFRKSFIYAIIKGIILHNYENKAPFQTRIAALNETCPAQLMKLFKKSISYQPELFQKPMQLFLLFYRHGKGLSAYFFPEYCFVISETSFSNNGKAATGMPP